MRPLDTIRTLGRPIAYHSSLARHVGGVCTAIFLGQLMYWDEISKDDLGVYKTSEEWEAETGLSYREQATARKKLRDMGILLETVKRLQHRIYYKLDREAFNTWIEGIVAEEHSEIPETTKAQFPNDENAIGGQHNPQLGDGGKRKSYIEKTTTETTAEITTTETTAEITNTPSSGSAEPDHVQEPKSRFQEFWEIYPSTGRRVAKAKCAQVWKTKKLESVADDILDHLRAVKTTQQWTTGYEPAPLTYLNQRRWEDGLPEVVPVQGVHVIGRSAAPSGGMNKQEALEARNMDVAQRWAQRGM